MKSYIASLALLLLPGVMLVHAQEKQNFTINPATPQGQLLQSLAQETDDAHKAALAEQFLMKFPMDPAAGWVSAQLESVLLTQKNNDKVLQVADAQYANAPDMDVAYYALKAALDKGDIPAVAKWSGRTSEAAKKLIAATATPANDADKHQLEYAKDVNEYSAYAMYAASLKAQPKEVIALVDQLEKQDPKSQYLPLATAGYFAALEKAGESGRACASADRMSAGASKNFEAMLVAADCSMRAQKGAGMVTYGNKAIEAIGSATKEAGLSDEQWAAKKADIDGKGRWYVGVGYCLEGRYGPANKSLREAMPMLKGNDQLHEMALFYLGLANYQLGKQIGDRGQMRQGMQFFQQAAAMSGPMQAQASRNAKAVQGELGR